MASSQFPYEIKNLTDEEDKVIKKYYKGFDKPFLRIGPSGGYLMSGYRDHAADIYNLDVRPDDIWVTTYPRSGTTWTQELVWLIMNNLDFVTARSFSLSDRYTYLESVIHKRDYQKTTEQQKHNPEFQKDYRNLPNVTSPRYIKSHLPLSLLPKTTLETAKIFYVARDPRDVAVSYYFAYKLFRIIDDTVQFKEFWDLFREDLVLRGFIFSHIKETWDKRHHPNMMFLFYEDMQNDMRSVIDRICKFVGKEYTDVQKQQLAEFVQFSNMKTKHPFDRKNDKEVSFFRKGKTGNWVQYFDEEMKKEAEEFMEKNLKETDMRFPDVIN